MTIYPTHILLRVYMISSLFWLNHYLSNCGTYLIVQLLASTVLPSSEPWYGCFDDLLCSAQEAVL